LYATLIDAVKALIESRAFAERHRFAETQFTRTRALPVSRVVLFLLNLVQGALQAELDRFGAVLQGVTVATRLVSKAAFSLARRKLHFGAFVEINQVILASFYRHQPVKRWHGLRLLAIDGSTAVLPRSAEVQAWFGVGDAAPQPPCVMGRISALYDVLNRLIVEAHLAPYRVGEHALALTHLDHLGAADLVLFDRGYPAFWLFALLRTQPLQYCMRLSATYSPAIEQFVRSGQPEQLLALTPGPEGRRACRRRGLAADPIPVRLVRVELPTGEVEVLITSLRDPVAYPCTEFAALYHQRWGIEEGYKALKCRAELENFTGRSVHAVMQDFHAKIVTTNLTALLAHQAQTEVAQTGRRHAVRVNFSHALASMKDTVVRLFSAGNRHAILEALLTRLRHVVELVRPGRSSPRRKRMGPPRFRATYKRCG
jgi:Transposase DDE domain